MSTPSESFNNFWSTFFWTVMNPDKVGSHKKPAWTSYLSIL